MDKNFSSYLAICFVVLFLEIALAGMSSRLPVLFVFPTIAFLLALARYDDLKIEDLVTFLVLGVFRDMLFLSTPNFLLAYGLTTIFVWFFLKSGKLARSGYFYLYWWTVLLSFLAIVFFLVFLFWTSGTFGKEIWQSLWTDVLLGVFLNIVLVFVFSKLILKSNVFLSNFKQIR